MYRRPKFLEILLEIREQMSRDVDYDVDLFAEMVRSGKISRDDGNFRINTDNNGARETDLKSNSNDPGDRFKS